MMGAKGEKLFSLTAHWIDMNSRHLGIPGSEWEVYVPYARCIPFLKQEFLTQYPDKKPPLFYSLVDTHPISLETRLGWMLSFLTPVLPHLSLAHRISMAQDALSLWEESVIYETPWHALQQVQEELFSQYQGATLHVLNYIIEDWPNFLKKKNPEYDVYLKYLNHRSDILTKPTLLVGSQGTLPSTRHFMKRLKEWHYGWVLFPYGPEIKDPVSPAHPMYGFCRTLLELQVHYKDIVMISHASLAFPFSKTKFSKPYPVLLNAQDAFLASYEGTCLTDCPTNTFEYFTVSTPLEEAYQVAQCVMTHYKMGKSVLCVTPDPVLAQGVYTCLTHEGVPLKWQNITPLAYHTSTHFIGALWQCLHKKWPFFHTIDFIKHSVFTSRYPVLFQWMCFLEDRYFRGNTLPDNLLEWLKRHGQHTPYPGIAKRIIRAFHTHIQPLSFMIDSMEPYPVTMWLQTLYATIQGLMEDTLWENTGKEVKKVLDALMKSADAYEAISGAEMEILLAHFFQNATLCFEVKALERLTICSPREARMMVSYYDLCIMTSLYEGGWPRAISSNPLLPLSLQELLNFPAPSWQTGLASRDFLACLEASQIIMTRAKNSGSPSRFVLRLQGVLPYPISECFTPFLYSPGAYSKPSIVCSSIKPGVISVSDMVLLDINPYGFFLKRILGIKPLLSFQQDAGKFGTSCHSVLENWIRRCPPSTSFPESVLRFHLMELVEKILFTQWTNTVIRSHILRFFEGILEYELQCRKHFCTSFLKVQGRYKVLTAFGPITLVAQADRVDHRTEGGVIIDYKTGKLSKHIQENGASTQVWWWAWLLEKRGFDGIGALSPVKVQWLHLSLSYGFSCIEAKIHPNLLEHIQSQWEKLEAYILGTKAYIPLETPNFTDGISRRSEWTYHTDTPC